MKESCQNLLLEIEEGKLKCVRTVRTSFSMEVGKKEHERERERLWLLGSRNALLIIEKIRPGF